MKNKETLDMKNTNYSESETPYINEQTKYKQEMNKTI